MTRSSMLLCLAILGAASSACGSSPPRLDTPQTLPPAEPQADLSRQPTTSEGAGESKQPKAEPQP
jgi:hypothetical protein